MTEQYIHHSDVNQARMDFVGYYGEACVADLADLDGEIELLAQRRANLLHEHHLATQRHAPNGTKVQIED